MSKGHPRASIPTATSPGGAYSLLSHHFPQDPAVEHGFFFLNVPSSGDLDVLGFLCESPDSVSYHTRIWH